uniref:Uncharacterized protein n=1 Tax=Medicago truncatula TaxID=3880 RepID=I3S187_MEDTR|nr:unknown [Medicago truncatula]
MISREQKFQIRIVKEKIKNPKLNHSPQQLVHVGLVFQSTLLISHLFSMIQISRNWLNKQKNIHHSIRWLNRTVSLNLINRRLFQS